MRKAVAGILALLAMLALTGCGVDAGIGVQAFDREQDKSDLLPDEALERFSGLPLALDTDSTRFLAEERGIEYFAATAQDGHDRNNLCLIMVPKTDPGQTTSECGGGGWIGSSSPSLGMAVELTSFEGGEREGWRMLAPNLYAKD